MLIVMFARVYYLCHYIMDTITGAIMGAIVAYFVL
jgi:membrane-associated phospholipid phosphatase